MTQARSAPQRHAEATGPEGNPTTAPDGSILRSPAHRWWVLVMVGIAQLMVVMSVTIANIALPQAQSELGMTASEGQWMITGYALAFGSLVLLGGRLSDLLGRKRVFVTGLAAFALASAVAGAAPNTAVLIDSRVAQGAAGALLAPTALAILATTFTVSAERARAFGIFGAISGAGAGIGLLAGGALTTTLGWQWCFFLQAPFAITAVIAAAILLRRVAAHTRPRMDLLGAVLAVGGSSSLVLALTDASDRGWGHPVTVVLLVAAAVLMVLFVLAERRHGRPLLPLTVLSDRDRAASFLAVVVLALASSGVFYFLTFYLQQVKGLSPMMTGLAFMPWSSRSSSPP